MSLERLRELEDLQEKKEKRLAIYQKRLKQDTDRIIADICKAFEKHMKASSFQVEKVEGNTTATYKNLIFTLFLPTAEDKRIGCITSLNLKDSRKTDEHYVVMVIDQSTGGNCVKLEQSNSDELEEIKNQIDTLKQMTKSFKKRSYHYIIYLDRAPPENPYPQKRLSQPIDTMKGLMDTISAS